MKCPNCGGVADNGNDRCVPPNAYVCQRCVLESDHIILLREFDKRQDAINEFCKASDWCSDSWKKQPHIKALFDLREEDV